MATQSPTRRDTRWKQKDKYKQIILACTLKETKRQEKLTYSKQKTH